MFNVGSLYEWQIALATNDRVGAYAGRVFYASDTGVICITLSFGVLALLSSTSLLGSLRDDCRIPLIARFWMRPRDMSCILSLLFDGWYLCVESGAHTVLYCITGRDCSANTLIARN